MERECPVKTSRRLANQAAYLGRLVNRTEVATRITNMNAAYLKAIASKYFWDKDTSVYAWGPLHNVMVDAFYNRNYKRATLGEYSIKIKFDY